ncbi:phage tail terminator protein [Candidatus Magnetominusculus xianensis]|uniref:Uncharacterized protein n=1 Tax=Candidatus Magnetominusculus xianensis TaxID=1748249 RepID=A0ABR5SFS5_9BACT|nr:hypothetical protein [Candidatus Magnetominusculus xianensis]KWT77360.1 hypothetical protein ASN18_3055 [Candidatus Magnetominusculus xianensis]MBF0404957.1 hypothetical protein [Nitrospirota bacterium]
MVDNIAVEASIQEKLTRLGIFQTVEPMQGNLEEIGALAIALPAAYTIYAGAKNITSSTGTHAVLSMATEEFQVYVLCENLRGRGDASQDVRSVLLTVRQSLHGMLIEDLSSGYRGITLTWQEENFLAFVRPGVCAYGQTYHYTLPFVVEKRR